MLFIFADLNSYFASVEQQANPELRGKPIGVCEHSGGIILAPSREAKKLGIKVGTPVWEAKKICPGIILLPTDPSKIRALTSRFYRIAEDYSDDIEHISVDDVSIKLDSCSYDQAVSIAREFKQRMKAEMGEWMTASIGIAENRLLAKIGTNLQKPDGLVLILDQARDLRVKDRVFSLGVNDLRIVFKQDLYNILDLQDVPGIGPRLKLSLASHGITSLLKLSQTPVGILHSWYGISGIWLSDLSNFRDAWRNIDLDERKLSSIGHQYSLGKRQALYHKAKTSGLFWKLAEKVTARMRKQNVVGSNVSAYIGYATGGGEGGSRQTRDFFNDTPTVVKVAQPWLELINFKKGISFIAVTVSGLIPQVEQGVLFEDFRLKKALSKTIDKINERFGDFAVTYGPTILAGDKARDTVGFGRTRERKDWQEF